MENKMILPRETTRIIVEPMAVLSMVLGNMGQIFDVMPSKILTAKSPAVHSFAVTPSSSWLYLVWW